MQSTLVETVRKQQFSGALTIGIYPPAQHSRSFLAWYWREHSVWPALKATQCTGKPGDPYSHQVFLSPGVLFRLSISVLSSFTLLNYHEVYHKRSTTSAGCPESLKASTPSHPQKKIPAIWGSGITFSRAALYAAACSIGSGGEVGDSVSQD